MLYLAEYQLEQIQKEQKINLIDDYIKKQVFDWKPNVVDVKAPFKWILAPILCDQFNAKSSVADSPFNINFQFENQEDDQQTFSDFLEVLTKMNEDWIYKKKNKKIKTEKPININVPKLEPNSINFDRIASLAHQFFLLNCRKNMPPNPVIYDTTIIIECSHDSLYVLGNYQKFSRYMSQTPWIIDGVQLYAGSLQEEIASELAPPFKPKEYKFSSGGREDVDVRMLGQEGRPFVIELINPRRISGFDDNFLKQMQDQINKKKDIQVNRLKFSDIKCFEILKESEINKVKAYACFVQFSGDFNEERLIQVTSMQDIILQQRTPFRVLHRRSLLTRKKIIHRLKSYKIDNKHIVLFVLASAGTYIKEFIHGDLERTIPNFGGLMQMEADIFQLDVIKLYEKLDQNTMSDFDKIAILPKALNEF